MSSRCSRCGSELHECGHNLDLLFAWRGGDPEKHALVVVKPGLSRCLSGLWRYAGDADGATGFVTVNAKLTGRSANSALGSATLGIWLT